MTIYFPMLSVKFSSSTSHTERITHVTHTHVVSQLVHYTLIMVKRRFEVIEAPTHLHPEPSICSPSQLQNQRFFDPSGHLHHYCGGQIADIIRHNALS